MRHWYIPKTPWVEKVCHLCEFMKVEDENNILLECLAYTLIRYEFHNICYNTNLYNLLTYQNYNELKSILTIFFYEVTKF